MATRDKKHWSAKSDLKHDELEDAVEIAFDWVLTNRAMSAGIFGGIVAVAAIASLLVYSHRARTDAAWNQLNEAESLAAGGHAADAQALLAQVSAGGGAAGGMALLLDGDMHYQGGQYDQAMASYNRAADEAPEALKPYALADQVQALEAAGKSDQCVAAAQSFIDTRGQDMLAPQVQATMARCQLAEGQTEAAKATLQKIALQYQGGFWEAWAKDQLNPPAPAPAAPAHRAKRKKH